MKLNWFETKRLEARVFFDYLRPIKKIGRFGSWSFGGPLMMKGAKIGYEGLTRAVEGVERTGHAAKEVATGAFKTLVSPFFMLVKSRLDTVKRFLWDLPIATASAAIRTPIAIAKSPFEMVLGVRDGIKNIPESAGHILSAVRNFRLGDLMSSTRKAVSDVILPPFARPVVPVVKPAVEMAGTAINAEAQTLSVMFDGIPKKMGEGGRQMRDSWAKSGEVMDEIRAAREARRALLQAEKDKKDEIIRGMIDEHKGVPTEVPKKAA